MIIDNAVDVFSYEISHTFCCRHKSTCSAQVRTHTCSNTHEHGLVSIFRATAGIWGLNLEAHFVKQISACWKTVKTCCPCVSISLRVHAGRFIFLRMLRVRAGGFYFTPVNFRWALKSVGRERVKIRTEWWRSGGATEMKERRMERLRGVQGH